MNIALAAQGGEEDKETVEDAINRLMEARKMLPNASYLAFTATPKNKTLEIFGDAYPEGDTVKHRPFHGYTMKQAIEEGFIRDVLQHYTPVESYYRLMKTVEDDPEFDVKKAQKTLRRYVESHGFPSNLIPGRFREDPYRFLICADKFQTGYDEPLLHTMYVDKPLSGIEAVQTLSRLNWAHPQKHDTFVLDFMNDSETIRAAFEDYYRTTILSDETDPNKLHDLKADLDGSQVYTRDQVDQFVTLYLGGADRDRLDPILDTCVATYIDALDEDGQVDFKGKAKAFVRTYGFLASILPYTNSEWEKLAIFLNFLILKLPAPKEEDLSKSILDALDMDSYRVEVRAAMSIALADQDAEIAPVPTRGGGRLAEPELDRLSNILKVFNEQFGNIDWKDADKIRQVIAEEIPAKVAADRAYQNAMKNSDKQNARIEHDKALQQVLVELLADHTELFRQFRDNPAIRKWLGDMIFSVTYTAPDDAQKTRAD
jgi:type I restriction enzyme R subunit